MAIDEVYLGKKRKFITIVVDLATGRVIHIGKGKGKDVLNGLWVRLKRSKANIKAVATDLASGYMTAVLSQGNRTLSVSKMRFVILIVKGISPKVCFEAICPIHWILKSYS